jgi:hypothetical protein
LLAFYSKSAEAQASRSDNWLNSLWGKPAQKKGWKRYFAKSNDSALLKRVADIANFAEARGIAAEDFLAFSLLETAGTLNPRIQNPHTKATGLCQFMPATARRHGTTVDKLKAMSSVEQLQFCDRYFRGAKLFRKTGGRPKLDELYTAIAAPSAVGKHGNTIVYHGSSAAYRANYKAWDVDRDGHIRKWEFGAAAKKYLNKAKGLLAQLDNKKESVG